MPGPWCLEGASTAPALSLTGLARGFSRLAAATSRRDAEVHAFTVNQAMLDYPWAVHGRGEANTVVLEDLGLTAKLGAEGVLVVGAPDGTAVTTTESIEAETVASEAQPLAA